MSTFQGWIVSLNNGTQYLEATSMPGDKTSWQQFIDFIKAENLTPTAMSLIWNGCRVHAISKADGYFQAYEAKKSMADPNKQTQVMRGIGTVVGDQILITWITETGEIRQDIRPLSENLIHTTLRP